MVVTETHVFVAILVYAGIVSLAKGEVEVESGITNGNSLGRTRFIYCVKTQITGLRAKIISAFFFVLAVLVYLYVPGDILLKL